MLGYTTNVAPIRFTTQDARGGENRPKSQGRAGMRKRWYRASAAVWLAVSGAGIGAAAPAAADPGAGETQYSVAFTNPSVLPANVEAMVSAQEQLAV